MKTSQKYSSAFRRQRKQTLCIEKQNTKIITVSDQT